MNIYKIEFKILFCRHKMDEQKFGNFLEEVCCTCSPVIQNIKSYPGQRPLDEAHVKRLVALWDLASDNEICSSVWPVSIIKTENGNTILMDGQHRFEVYRRFCSKNRHIPIQLLCKRGSIMNSTSYLHLQR